ncbi:hypothetical protein ACJO2E_14465 [Marinobacter sp. M1N3S26]|uniref:hypothetical protein n=1 Tax=unclassified Marinobacter TaxID=83889 RepID=UPI00387B5615
MIISAEVQHVYPGSATMRRENEAEKRPVDSVPGDTIPPRYRDGRGGVALERVQKDRREARRQVVRAMMRRLGDVWG